MEKINISEYIIHKKMDIIYYLNIEKSSGYLYEYCGSILSSRSTLRRHMENTPAEKLKVYTGMEWDKTVW